MKPRLNNAIALAAAGIAASACVHTPPGTSVEIALAKKADLIRLPEAQRLAAVKCSRNTAMPPIEPDLPVLDDRVEAEAEAFTRGKFAMADGKDAEAITAFEDAVKIAPTNQEAWQHLAMLYEKTGAGKKAIAAFRRSKSIAKQ